MMPLLRPLLVLLLMAVAARVVDAATALPSDVGVTLTATPTTNLQPGQPIDMVVTVTNYGPEALPNLSLASTIYVDEIYLVSQTLPECFLVLDVADTRTGEEYEIQWIIAGLGPPPIPAGETLTCHFQMALTSAAPSPYTFSFRLPSYYSDPNPSNNVATVTLQRALALLPTPVTTLSNTMLLLLAGLLATTAGVACRCRWRS